MYTNGTATENNSAVTVKIRPASLMICSIVCRFIASGGAGIDRLEMDWVSHGRECAPRSHAVVANGTIARSRTVAAFAGCLGE